MKYIFWPVLLMSAIALLLLPVGLNWAITEEAPGSPLALTLAFLFPVGLTLIAWSVLPPDRSEYAATVTTLAWALALIGYLASGFGFHFGGVASISRVEGLQYLARFFSLVRGDSSSAWGFIGLSGFALGGPSVTDASLLLFLAHLPVVTSVILLVLLSLPHRTPPPAQLLVALLVSAFLYPLAGFWVNGGGWLAQLGKTLAMGHGFVDFAGSGTVFVLGGAIVLAAALVFRDRGPVRADDPADADAGPVASRFPLLAALGVPLAAVGWVALPLANPLYVEAGGTLNWPLIVVNGLGGLSAAALSAQIYSWFTTGRFDPLMGPRGALAGLVAISAGAPFVPLWAALLIGAVAGFLLPLATFVVERLINTENAGAAIAGYGLPGAWGLLAVALFADGRWGLGWNDTGNPPGQGVAGLLVPAGVQADAGQLGAQVWGTIALFILGFLLPWVVMKLAKLLTYRRLLVSEPGVPSQVLVDHPSPAGEHPAAVGGFDRVASVDDHPHVV